MQNISLQWFPFLEHVPYRKFEPLSNVYSNFMTFPPNLGKFAFILRVSDIIKRSKSSIMNDLIIIAKFQLSKRSLILVCTITNHLNRFITFYPNLDKFGSFLASVTSQKGTNFRVFDFRTYSILFKCKILT